MTVAKRADAVPILAQFFARVRATEWSASHIKELSDTLALADISLVRFTAEGREVERIAFMYVLHKTSSGWKIAVLASHPAENTLHLAR